LKTTEFIQSSRVKLYFLISKNLGNDLLVLVTNHLLDYFSQILEYFIQFNQGMNHFNLFLFQNKGHSPR